LSRLSDVPDVVPQWTLVARPDRACSQQNVTANYYISQRFYLYIACAVGVRHVLWNLFGLASQLLVIFL